MMSKSLFLCLFLLACPIYCIKTKDKVTIHLSSLEEFSQTQLSTSDDQVLEWGSTASDIHQCSGLSNKYYDTLAYQQTISKQFEYVSPHNNVYVTFDVIFLNIASGNPVKHGQIDIDGTVKEFSGKVKSNYYSCMSRKSLFHYDGYTNTVGLLFSNSRLFMNISIKPTDLGTQARMGIANMKIYLAECGDNASFDTSALKCLCNSGYQQNDVTVGEEGSNYYHIEKRCVKV